MLCVVLGTFGSLLVGYFSSTGWIDVLHIGLKSMCILILLDGVGSNPCLLTKSFCVGQMYNYSSFERGDLVE